MKIKKILCSLIVFSIIVALAACSNNSKTAIELMGAGDKIHDSYTFANIGTKIKYEGDNVYKIYGSVDKLTDVNVKSEFEIEEKVEYVVAIKLSAVDESVVKDEVEIYVDGAENYDAEHLNGASFTYIILEAKQGVSVNISVKWNKDADTKEYVVKFDENLQLK